MLFSRRHRNPCSLIAMLGACSAASFSASAQSTPAEAPSETAGCPRNDSGLTLPPGFCATIFVDGIGHARHLVVAANGVVYVNTWSGRYYGNDTPHAGGFLVALQDTTGAGVADVNERFGESVQSGGAGGTGIGLYKGSLFAEINDKADDARPPEGTHPDAGGAAATASLPVPAGVTHEMVALGDRENNHHRRVAAQAISLADGAHGRRAAYLRSGIGGGRVHLGLEPLWGLSHPR